MKKIILALVLLLPFTSFAEVPAFPMAFWGVATIDGVIAPAGSVIEVYGGSSKVGEVIVKDGGVYGYTEPTKQKLLVEETNAPLSFTIQSVGVNGGVETAGLVAITHPGFVSGETVQKNLDFKITTQSTGGSSSGGGGGGGGGNRKAKVSTPIVEPLVLGQATTTVTSDEELRIQLQKQLIVLLTQLIALLQQRMAM